MKNVNKILKIHKETTLLPFLTEAFPSESRNKVKSLLKNGFCSVDGELTTQFNHPLVPGSTLEVSLQNAARSQLPFRIIYEDKDIVVIDKPAGLLCVANEKERTNTAYRILSDYVKCEDPSNKIFIVHRLDKDTSGVVLFAKNEATKKAYQDNWDSLVKVRRYVALCEGRPENERGTLVSYLRENHDHRVYVTTNPHRSQKAITDYKIIAESNNLSLLEIELQTGRKNQIRAQLSEAGFPIAGDKKYGAESNPVRRLALHATVLSLRSPFGKEYTFRSTEPKCFRRALLK